MSIDNDKFASSGKDAKYFIETLNYLNISNYKILKVYQPIKGIYPLKDLNVIINGKIYDVDMEICRRIIGDIGNRDNYIILDYTSAYTPSRYFNSILDFKKSISNGQIRIHKAGKIFNCEADIIIKTHIIYNSYQSLLTSRANSDFGTIYMVRALDVRKLANNIEHFESIGIFGVNIKDNDRFGSAYIKIPITDNILQNCIIDLNNIQ